MCSEDNTDIKGQYQLRIKGLLATEEERKELFDQFVSCEGYSFMEQRYIMLGFISKFVCKDVKKTYFQAYFDNFVKVFKTKSSSAGRNWLMYLFPKTSDKQFLATSIQTVIDTLDKTEDATLVKKLLQKLDDNERAAKVLGIELK